MAQLDAKSTGSIPTGECRFCGVIRRALRVPHAAFVVAYKFVFARPSMQVFNDALLQLALKGRGFNNCCDPKSTGEEIFLKLLARHNPTLCVDVGANEGLYSQCLLDLTRSKIIAFEPLPKVFGRISALQTKYPDRVVAVNKGVGARNEVLDLHFGEESWLASFSTEINEIDYVGASNLQSVKVQVVTLDSYFAEAGAGTGEIDLIKIDTEGFEYEVLAGAQETIRTRRPKFIQIEYNWHQLFKAHSLFKLASLLPGYMVYQLLPHGSGLSRVDVKRPESIIFHFSNFVFVRSDIAL